MTEALTIDCPELSGLSGNFISERSCKIYRELNDCPEACPQHPNIDRIVTTMPQAVTSLPNTEASTPEPTPGHPGESEKKNGRGLYQKLARWCPDLERHIYNITCQRRYRGDYCLKPCEYKTQLDETGKARKLRMEELTEKKIRQEEARVEPEPFRHSPEPIHYTKLRFMLEEKHRARQKAESEFRDVEAQILWELQRVIENIKNPITEDYDEA